MSNVHPRRPKGGGWTLAAAGVLGTALVGCTSVDTVEVTASAPPRPPVTAPEVRGSVFQGSVASVDPAAGELVVAVRIVWAPVLKAESFDRRVAVGPATRWKPVASDLAALHVGEEVQVEAVEGPDGAWVASTISLFDID